MKDRIKGLFRGPNEADFASEQTVRRELAIRGQTPVRLHSRIIRPKNFDEHADHARERAKSQEELSPRTESVVKVRMPRTSIVSVIGDTHLGHPKTDYRRLQREVEVVANSPDSYAILTGDLAEGIHWGGAGGGEQVLNLDEQHGMMRGLWRKLKGKVIVGVSGEHDSKWAAQRGSDPYSQFTEETGAPYVRGIAEVEAQVGDQKYRIVGQHRARGFSMYNKNHPTYRQSRFHLQGADVYISAHRHQKQVSQEALRDFGKTGRVVTHVAAGTYKGGDEYSDRQGFVPQVREEMGGASFRLHAGRKKVDVEPDIVEAHQRWVGQIDEKREARQQRHRKLRKVKRVKRR